MSRVIPISKAFETAAKLTRVDRTALPHWAKHAKLSEECGELAEADLIANGLKERPVDEGVIGESADAILCILDLLATSTEFAKVPADQLVAKLEFALSKKLDRWVERMKCDHNFITCDYPRGYLIETGRVVPQEKPITVATVAPVPAPVVTQFPEVTGNVNIITISNPFNVHKVSNDVNVPMVMQPPAATPIAFARNPVQQEQNSVDEFVRKRTSNRVIVLLGGFITGVKITESSLLVQDFGFDELDFIEIAMAIEDDFGIEVSDEVSEQWKTVGDIVNTTCTLVAAAKANRWLR